MIDGLIDPKSSKGNDTKSSKDKDKLGGEGKPKEIQKTSLPPKSMNDSSRIVSNEQEMINTLV